MQECMGNLLAQGMFESKPRIMTARTRFESGEVEVDGRPLEPWTLPRSGVRWPNDVTENPEALRLPPQPKACPTQACLPAFSPIFRLKPFSIKRRQLSRYAAARWRIARTRRLTLLTTLCQQPLNTGVKTASAKAP
ncbi:hypothetical protein GCM10010975_28140 [Comamonas phosphati]|nr:hypothetical protein GCM10010975_28140 [Comamonas phosphati]